MSRALFGSGKTLHDIMLGTDSSLHCEMLGPQSRLLFETVGRACTMALSELAFEAPIISSSVALHDLLRFEMAPLRRECLRVLYLDTGKRLVADRVLAEGGIGSVDIEPREIMRLALFCDATDLILVHNHPSNIALPSMADVKLTRAIVAAGRTCGVRLLDHLIVTRSQVFSLRAEGLLKNF